LRKALIPVFIQRVALFYFCCGNCYLAVIKQSYP